VNLGSVSQGKRGPCLREGRVDFDRLTKIGFSLADQVDPALVSGLISLAIEFKGGGNRGAAALAQPPPAKPRRGNRSSGTDQQSAPSSGRRGIGIAGLARLTYRYVVGDDPVTDLGDGLDLEGAAGEIGRDLPQPGDDAIDRILADDSGPPNRGRSVRRA
jgi:hypothetical protein